MSRLVFGLAALAIAALVFMTIRSQPPPKPIDTIANIEAACASVYGPDEVAVWTCKNERLAEALQADKVARKEAARRRAQ